MTGTDPAEALYERLAPGVRALMQELRGVVRAAMPQATERVHLCWRRDDGVCESGGQTVAVRGR